MDICSCEKNMEPWVENVGKLEGSFPGNVGNWREILALGGKFIIFVCVNTMAFWKIGLPSKERGIFSNHAWNIVPAMSSCFFWALNYINTKVFCDLTLSNSLSASLIGHGRYS